jgi:hypothetical protein
VLVLALWTQYTHRYQFIHTLSLSGTNSKDSSACIDLWDRIVFQVRQANG